jgi:hypothetical protein
VTTPALQQQPTPDRFLNAVHAYELTEAIKTTVELEIFTAIAEGNTTSARIAMRTGEFMNDRSFFARRPQ